MKRFKIGQFKQHNPIPLISLESHFRIRRFPILAALLCGSGGGRLHEARRSGQAPFNLQNFPNNSQAQRDPS